MNAVSAARDSGTLTNREFGFIFTPLIVLLISEMLLSLKWRMSHDTPQLFYMAFLMDHFGYVPYRDFFEINMPGTHWLFLLLARIFGYTDVGVRFADLLFVLALFGTTVAWMKTFGYKVALCGAVMFSLCYFNKGESMGLQRDFLLIVPISLALLTVLAPLGIAEAGKAFIIGLLFGLCFIFKPTGAIGLPVLVGFQCIECYYSAGTSTFPWRRVGMIVSFAALGFAAVISAGAGILWYNGSLDAFRDIVVNYWPLYNSLSASNESPSGLELRLKLLVFGGASLGGRGEIMTLAAFGAYLALYSSTLDEKRKRVVVLLGILAVCYFFYVLLAGKFWTYHWLPFWYFGIMLSALCLTTVSTGKGWVRKFFPVAVMIVSLLPSILPAGATLRVITGEPYAPKHGRVDEIASFLKRDISATATVQVLDWTGGALHALLLARAKTATPFLYDMLFYHHVSHEYIQTLRQRFLADLVRNMPDYIVEVYGEDKPWVHGQDTTRDFPELRSLIATYYHPVFDGNGCRIFKKNSKDAFSVGGRLRPTSIPR